MVLSKLPSSPCGNRRPNCRALAAPGTERKTLCQLHTAWCTDDFNPQPPEPVVVYLSQRSFRTGDW